MNCPTVPKYAEQVSNTDSRDRTLLIHAYVDQGCYALKISVVPYTVEALKKRIRCKLVLAMLSTRASIGDPWSHTTALLAQEMNMPVYTLNALGMATSFDVSHKENRIWITVRSPNPPSREEEDTVRRRFRRKIMARASNGGPITASVRPHL